MKLLRLKLSNFKGIESLELETGGENFEIFGDNATGKTTVADAVFWLLFDKDSKNRADFGIKTLKSDGSVIHHLDHEVEGVFSVRDQDEPVTLRKVYREKWVRRRGAAKDSFSGHETDYFIDNVPVRKMDYDEKIKSFAPEDVFRLLTSPTYFSEQLHWEERREMLLDICGDVTDKEVIESNEKLAALPQVLGKRSLEEHRKIVKARQRLINTDLDDLKVRIDEAKKNLPDISDVEDAGLIDKHLKSLIDNRRLKERDLNRLLEGGIGGKARKKVAECEVKLIELETSAKKEHAKKGDLLQAKIREWHEKIQDALSKKDRAQKDLEDTRREADALETSMQELRAKWHDENTKVFEHEDQDTCPTCGQTIPAEQVEEARAKALAAFNTSKAQKLEQINLDGKAAKKKHAELTGKISALEKNLKDLEDTISRATEKHAELQTEKARHDAAIEDFRQAEEYVTLEDLKAYYEKAVEEDTEATDPEKQKLEAEIKSLDEGIDKLKSAKTRLELHETGIKRVEELQQKLRDLAAEYERIEQQIHLMEEFVKTKVRLLTAHINREFQLARFKLFDVQVNQEIRETCETTFGGVSWHDLNNGAKVNVGLDIINTLSKHHGFTPPIFVDNAEAVTELIPTEGQLIKLVVTKEDKTLRVEGEGKPTLVQKTSLFKEAI